MTVVPEVKFETTKSWIDKARARRAAVAEDPTAAQRGGEQRAHWCRELGCAPGERGASEASGGQAGPPEHPALVAKGETSAWLGVAAARPAPREEGDRITRAQHGVC